MSRQRETKWAELLAISIDPANITPIFRQISLQLKKAVMLGTLPAGSRVPSSRELAKQYGVSRNAVSAAYDELQAEGFLAGRAGSGTFVAQDLPSLDHPPALPRGDGARRLSEAGYRYRNLSGEAVTGLPLPFSTGRCSIDPLSIEAWRRISVAHLKTVPSDALGYGDPLGRLSLRQVVAEYLRAFRGVNCRAEQVMITSGAQQAIDLSIRVLLNAGDPAWVEDPGYPATWRALRAAGMHPTPVPVDDEGMIVSAGRSMEPKPRAIFVTPGHQFPTGATMSADRRQALLDAAAEADAWVLEDDYDSEFRYAGLPVSSLQGMDRGARVIYIGTLSKVIFPGLRTGYVVIPDDLIDAYRGARYLTDRGPPVFYQAALEEFMREGFFTSHIRRMRKRYKAARDAVMPDLRAALGPYAVVHEPSCGMRILARLHDGIDDVAVVEEAARRGVVTRAISPLHVAHPAVQGLDLGFTGHDVKRMQVAAVRLGEAIAHVAKQRR